MIQTKRLADGVMEIRVIGDDGELDAIVEVTRPSCHGLLISHLCQWQDEVRQIESRAPSEGQLLEFPRSQPLASTPAVPAPSRQRRLSATRC